MRKFCLELSEEKDKLLSHYVVTGDQESLKQLEFEDPIKSFNQTLFTGDIEKRIKILAEVGQVSLAYATAKLHGITKYVEALENAVPDIGEKVVLKDNALLLVPPRPLV